jgi:hypothetical protein
MTERQPLSLIWEQRRELATGVVHEEVDPAELGVGLVAQGVDLDRVTDVRGDRQASDARGAHRIGGLLEGLEGATGHDDVGAVAGEPERGLAPDAGAPTGDQRDPAAEEIGGEGVEGARAGHRRRRGLFHGHGAGGYDAGGPRAARRAGPGGARDGRSGTTTTRRPAEAGPTPPGRTGSTPPIGTMTGSGPQARP